MGAWKVSRPSRACALTGRPLPPDAAVVTALFGEPEEVTEDKVRGAGLVRKDFLVEGAPPEDLQRALEGAFCTWRTRTPPADPRKEHRLDLGLARELLERMLAQADPTRAPVVLTLALLLVRRRQLHLVSEKDGVLTLRWPKGEGTFEIPSVVVPEAEEAALQQELRQLFQF